MIAVIKGDIINSRKLKNPDKWIIPLRNHLNEWGKEFTDWELVWGDFFQIVLKDPRQALSKTIALKALIKSVEAGKKYKNLSTIDVRMSIGLGKSGYSGKKLSESSGEAFVYAGEKFDVLKKKKINLALHSANPDFNREMNLYLQMASVFMDSWSISSAELVRILMAEPHLTQAETGKKLGIKQNSVSGRRARSHIDLLIELDKVYRDKLNHIYKL